MRILSLTIARKSFGSCDDGKFIVGHAGCFGEYCAEIFHFERFTYLILLQITLLNKWFDSQIINSQVFEQRSRFNKTVYIRTQKHILTTDVDLQGMLFFDLHCLVDVFRNFVKNAGFDPMYF